MNTDSNLPTMDKVKVPVTVVIPVRNEEINLPRCLDRLGRFEQVVVVDSGSTDRTREIALSYGCEFVEFRWDGRFPKKRNWLLINHAPVTPWVFFLDADEHVPEAFVDELARTLASTKHAGLEVVYTNHFLGKMLRYGVPQIKLPIFRVGAGLYERIDEEKWSRLDMEVHEHPVLDGSVGRLTTRVDHQDFKGLDAYKARHTEYAAWEARRTLRLLETPDSRVHLTAIQKRKYASIGAWWLAPTYFLYSYLRKFGILDGYAGLVFALMKAKYFSQIRRNLIALRGSSAPRK